MNKKGVRVNTVKENMANSFVVPLLRTFSRCEEFARSSLRCKGQRRHGLFNGRSQLAYKSLIFNESSLYYLLS